MEKASPKGYPEYIRIIYAFVFSTVVAALLMMIGAIKAHNYYYTFLLYNLLLAYVAPLLAWWLIVRLRTTPWLNISNILITLLWLGFLPNSFYMITDLIHSQTAIGVDLLFNVVIVMAFIFNACAAGFISLYLVHWALLKRFYYRYAHIVIAIVLLLCSFAIYLGRFLRWNSWNVVTDPAGILFDVSDTIISPRTHPEVFATTASFFLLLGSMYIVIWQVMRTFQKPVKTS